MFLFIQFSSLLFYFVSRCEISGAIGPANPRTRIGILVFETRSAPASSFDIILHSIYSLEIVPSISEEVFSSEAFWEALFLSSVGRRPSLPSSPPSPSPCPPYPPTWSFHRSIRDGELIVRSGRFRISWIPWRQYLILRSVSDTLHVANKSRGGKVQFLSVGGHATCRLFNKHLRSVDCSSSFAAAIAIAVVEPHYH